MFFYKFIPNTFYILYILYAGTETNVPPEFITDKKYDISKEAVRSIGITIYEMLYGRAPYSDYKKFSDVISGLPQLDNVSDGKCIYSFWGVLSVPLETDIKRFVI